MAQNHATRRALADIGNIEGPLRACGGTVPQPQLSVKADAEAAENREEDAGAGANRGKTTEDSPTGDEAGNSVMQVEDCSKTEAKGESVLPSSKGAGIFDEVEMEEEEEEEEEEEDYLPSDIGEAYVIPAVQYGQNIYDFYFQTEAASCVPPDYLSAQPDITEWNRAILINWLAQTHCKMGLLHETLFLTVNLTDRYLSRERVEASALEVVGAAALILACKHEEVGIPNIKHLLRSLELESKKNEIWQTERNMLQVLEFKVTLPTPALFMTPFLKAAESDIHLEMVSYFLLELSLMEYDMLKYRPSILAAAAVYTGRCVLGVSPPWNDAMHHHTTYTEDDLRECAKVMVRLHQHAQESKCASVYEKYSIPKFYFAAAHKPALWLL